MIRPQALILCEYFQKSYEKNKSPQRQCNMRKDLTNP